MKKTYNSPELETVNAIDVVTTSGENDVTTEFIPLNQGGAGAASNANYNL